MGIAGVWALGRRSHPVSIDSLPGSAPPPDANDPAAARRADAQRRIFTLLGCCKGWHPRCLVPPMTGPYRPRPEPILRPARDALWGHHDVPAVGAAGPDRGRRT